MRGLVEEFRCNQCDKIRNIDNEKEFSEISDQLHFCSEQCAIIWMKVNYRKGKDKSTWWSYYGLKTGGVDD
jgi:hypothetical protein